MQQESPLVRRGITGKRERRWVSCVLERDEELAHLGVDVEGVVDGLGDGGADALAVAIAEAVDLDGEGAGRDAEAGGERGVFAGVGFAAEEGLERLEGGRAARVRLDGGEASHAFLHEGEGPVAVEQAVGRDLMGGLGPVAFLEGEGVEGGGGDSAAALQGGAAFVLADEEVVQGGEEEGAEASAFPGEACEVVALEEPGEEGLGEILGGMRIMAAAPDEGVERVPVGAADLFECVASTGAVRIARACGEDEGPACGGEEGGSWGGLGWIRTRHATRDEVGRLGAGRTAEKQSRNRG